MFRGENCGFSKNTLLKCMRVEKNYNHKNDYNSNNHAKDKRL